MSKLIPITVFSIIMAIVSHYHSKYDIMNDRYIRKERFFFMIMAAAMILFVGLRTSYNDTNAYLSSYEAMNPDAGILEGIVWMEIGGNPGFVVTNRILVHLGVDSQTFLLVYATATVGIYLWFIRKYTCNLPLSIFILITFAGYTFSLAAIKQCIAMALCLIATDRAINKKYRSFVVFVLIASLYHPYALMYLVVPFLSFQPWGFRTVLMLGVFAVLGISLQSLLGGVLNITDMLGEEYDAASFQGEGVNPFRLIAVSVPVLLSFLTRNSIAREGDEKQYVVLNLTMLNAEIMFVGLFGTANYFARLANYFLPFQALSIPWLFTHFNSRSRRFITISAVVCYSFFFIYSFSMVEKFDWGYYSISFWDYLKMLRQGA